MSNRQPFMLIQYRSLRWGIIAFVVFACFLYTGCSIKRTAVNRLGDALAGGGASFANDDDPELIRDAVPFSLKLMESLLAESPSHSGLLLACARGFTQYSFAFVELEADEMEGKDLARAMEMRMRARRLYLRGRDYGLRGLETASPGFVTLMRADPQRAVRTLKPADVPLIYWTAASWAGAISVLKDNADLIADLPVVEALIDRALELDEGFDHGAIHSFLIAYEMNRQTGTGDREEKARNHFRRARELSGGRLSGPLVALAENVSLAKQDKGEFQSLLQQALGIPPGETKEFHLTNIIMQRRARWLLSHMDELFVD